MVVTMGPEQKTLVLFCCSLLASYVTAQGPARCPERWSLFRDNCYRMTVGSVRHDQLANACQQLGGAAVSIHSAQENDFVAGVAGGKYIWLGLKVTGSDTLTWADGTPYSYAKFLPAGNRMLKKKFVGAGIFQQSCRRWNYGQVSDRRYGVCKRPASRCPNGALERDGYCFFIANQPAKWWNASGACFETDRHAVTADPGAQDYQLNFDITSHFGGDTKLLVQVERVEGALSLETCSWTTVQYGQRTSHECQYACAEPHQVLCKRLEIVDANSAEISAPLDMMPPMNRGEAAALTAPECPSGWATLGRRCVSGPTRTGSRLFADPSCEWMESSRLAAVQTDIDKKALAQQLRLHDIPKAWVRDERPAAIRYQVHQERLLGGAAAALVQPGYSVLTSDGELVSMPAQAELPAICERCPEPCGLGAVTFAGHCYRLLDERRTLVNATRSCAALGGTLASIESINENSFVSRLVFPDSSGQCSQLDSGAWLGLQRSSIAFGWEWQDCSQLSTQLWAPGAGHVGTCAYLSRDADWRDSDRCDQMQKLAVCEWDACEEPGQYGRSCGQLATGPIY